MTTPIRLIDGLAFVAVTLQVNGQVLSLEHVLLDTGSAGTVFKTDALELMASSPSRLTRSACYAVLAGMKR